MLFLDIQPKDVDRSIQSAFCEYTIPTEVLEIPLLKKKRAEKEGLLCEHLDCLTPENIPGIYERLVERMVLPSLRKSIEKLVCEKIHWSKRLEKCAGRESDIHIHTQKHTFLLLYLNRDFIVSSIIIGTF